MKSPTKLLWWGAAAIAAALAGYAALRPQPVPVDLGAATRGDLTVTVDEDGRTRIRERYIVSTPLGGRLRRISLKPGDPVVAGETLLTTVEPSDPGLLDSRARAQAEARAKAAEAASERASAELDRAREAKRFADAELQRAADLKEKGFVPGSEFDRLQFEARTAGDDVRGAEHAVQIAAFELEQARAALMLGSGAGEPDAAAFPIRSPISGKVLRVMQESSTVVAPGAPLVELGDPSDLEIVVDVLSSDGVKIDPGAAVKLEHWGGDAPLDAQVRLVEPAAFTKVSALGVEEQRVNVIIDFVGQEDLRANLGDGFRVEARIAIWDGKGVLKIPVGALFREGDRWAVFADAAGTAELKAVERGHSNGIDAEILSGLDEGERIVLHPGESVSSGTLIEAR